MLATSRFGSRGLRLLLLIVSAAGAGSCGGGGDIGGPPDEPPGPLTVATVELTPMTLNLAVGQMSQLTATVRAPMGAP